MKNALKLIIMAFTFCSCGNSAGNKTANSAEISSSQKEKLPTGAIATSNDGWMMKAKINGKEYSAYSILLPQGTPQIVGYYDGDKYIGLPYEPKNLVAGKQISFSNQNATLTTNDEVQVRSGNKGEMEITKVDGKWAEGKFFFTAESFDADKTKNIEVTDGFFRIPLTTPTP